jgi:LysR family glycine cleavage system transcriptional activator
MTTRSRLPLNALRVFEAAARHGRFDRAADELAITPGAVSRQVKALELELGLRLFDRFNRAVRLTESGATLAEGVRDGLGRMEQAVERARPRTDGPLVVSVLHSMAVKWLVPRLHLFYERYPDAEVLVSASDRNVDLAREADVALRYGPGPYPGLAASKLASGMLFPVCSPTLLEGPDPLREPSDLARVLLLHDDNLLSAEPVWSDWLNAVGATGVDGARGLRFSNTYLSLEEARSGRGVVLAHEVLVLDDLKAGRLVRPFPQVIDAPFLYWCLCLPERADQPRIRRFRTWLLDQARRDGVGVE